MLESAMSGDTFQGDQPPPAKVRALLLDDSNFDRARIRRLSRKSDLPIQLDEVGSIEELDAAVKESTYDLILLDYRLPVGDGMQALDHVLKNPNNRNAGKIMITGDGATKTAVEAMRGGCHDFVDKEGMSAEVLNRAMVNAMTLARQRQQQELQLAHQREVIRQGLVAALSDPEVTGSLAASLRQHLQELTPRHSLPPMEEAQVDALIAGLTDEDEFIFH